MNIISILVFYGIIAFLKYCIELSNNIPSIKNIIPAPSLNLYSMFLVNNIFNYKMCLVL